MTLYQIADLTVEMPHISGITLAQAAAYQCDAAKGADITIDLSPEYLAERHAEMPHLTMNQCEYMWTGHAFYQALLQHRGCMLHASAICYEGQAYLFSAPSGTGKSTHTALWASAFGAENVTMINDDKPAIREVNGEFYVYGTPWSGKNDSSRNIRVPLAGICFLHRGDVNQIERISSKNALAYLMTQTVRPLEEAEMDSLFSILNDMLCAVPMYRMRCTVSEEAAHVAYSAMKQGKEETK